MVNLSLLKMKTRRDFLKKTALFGASAFMAPSLFGQEDEAVSSSIAAPSMLVPKGNALKITGTFLDEISHDIPHQNWVEQEWHRHYDSVGLPKVYHLPFQIFIEKGSIYAINGFA